MAIALAACTRDDVVIARVATGASGEQTTIRGRFQVGDELPGGGAVVRRPVRAKIDVGAALLSVGVVLAGLATASFVHPWCHGPDGYWDFVGCNAGANLAGFGLSIVSASFIVPGSAFIYAGARGDAAISQRNAREPLR